MLRDAEGEDHQLTTKPRSTSDPKHMLLVQSASVSHAHTHTHTHTHTHLQLYACMLELYYGALITMKGDCLTVPKRVCTLCR